MRQKPSCLRCGKNLLACGAAKTFLPVVRQKPSCLWCGKRLLACGAACGKSYFACGAAYGKSFFACGAACGTNLLSPGQRFACRGNNKKQSVCQMILQLSFLFYYVFAKSFQVSLTAISLSCDIYSAFQINLILPLWITFILLISNQIILSQV